MEIRKRCSKESVPKEWRGVSLGPCMHGAEEAEVVRENDIVEHDAEDDVVKYDAENDTVNCEAEIPYGGTIHRDRWHWSHVK